ncbi:MAG: hypothetical protein AAF404_19280, partial [Pseudomonadota bacterium]
MNKLRIIPLVLSVAMLSACGSGDSEPDMGAALSAIGGGVPAPVTTPTSTPLVNIPVVDTKSLIVSDDFAFDTAQKISVDFDLTSARGTEGAVSICTSYEQDSSGFDIDYNSCTVRGTMNDGVFSHTMEVTNEFESVVAVVWFQDSSIQPEYREFT